MARKSKQTPKSSDLKPMVAAAATSSLPMNWNQLISTLRFGKDALDEPKPAGLIPFRTPYEVDYDRIIYSEPFRRLARKTQVHPLAINDHVRTRLTHSLEVASVGRSLGHRLTGLLREKNLLPDSVESHDLSWIIQSACLAHDIGNPPFGHAGEYAIRSWSKSHTSQIFGAISPSEESPHRLDFEYFEGNAQGFRIAARSDNHRAGYLRLTFASLGAMIKYPWDSSDPRTKVKSKCNAFSTEKSFLHTLAEHTGMSRPGGKIVRHPVSFLTEAADDICYRILDLEDAVEMKILTEGEVRNVFLEIIEVADNDSKNLAQLRAEAITKLVNAMWSVFINDYDSIMRGAREDDLKSGLVGGPDAGMATVKQMYQRIFAERNKIAAELGAYKALGRILGALCHATRELAEKGSYEKAGFVDRRCLDLAWGADYVKKNEKERQEWWLHQVLDFTAGLTDNYARQLSREIEGT